MTGVDVAALRKLHEAATPGEWEAEHNGYDVYETRSAHGDVVAEAGLTPADARYIAAVRNALPALLDAAEALDRVRALCDETEVIAETASEWMEDQPKFGISVERLRAAIEGGA